MRYPEIARRIAELRAEHLATGKPFPGSRTDDKNFASAYRSTLVVATGTGRFKPTEQEQRSDAALAVKRGTPSLLESILFGTRRRANTELQEVRRLSKETGLSFQDCHIALCCQRQTGKPAIDTLNKIRAVQSAKRIARAAELQREEARKDLFNDLSASGTQRLRTELDVISGVRPSDEAMARRGYGFTDLRSDYGCRPSDAGFNGRPRMEGDGQTQDPTQSLRTYPSYDDGEDADDVDDHEQACAGHRACAQRASIAHGVEHHKAADAHDRAARCFNTDNSLAARGASYRANHFKMTDDMVS
jgi:hypothetical protein